MASYNWRCPHCEKFVTIADSNNKTSIHHLHIKNVTGQDALVSTFIVCPNPDCQKYTLDVSIVPFDYPSVSGRNNNYFDAVFSMRLVPFGSARTFPEYVPAAIRNDYAEACIIRDLSPKASATLARRAVQGVLRDFFGITQPTLKRELDELEKRIGTDVSQETWDGIDAVRTVGNIGAHMENDINVIVDVEPDEAQLLIGLVESLIEDTYIARAGRQERSAKLKALKQSKDDAKKGAQ